MARGTASSHQTAQPTLTERQAAFVREFLTDLNGTQAAIRAGYSPKAASQQAATLLSYPKVQAEIEKAKAARIKRTEISADKVLTDITKVISRCLQEEPVLDRDGNPTGEYRFEANPALKGLELLGRHLKMFTDKTEIGVDQSVQSLITQLQGSALRLKK